MKNVAIILASGAGTRFDSKLPKQFVKLAGKPVIEYTIEVFESCSAIHEIVIVTKNEFVDFTFDLINQKLFKKISGVISGGQERWESTLAALNAISHEDCNLIIHDAVRPFVSQRIIKDCINQLDRFYAIDVVVDAIDTIVRVDGDFVSDIPDRRYLRRGQTPQAFKKSVLMSAYHKFIADTSKSATDDCGIVRKYLPEILIKTVKGEEENFKITHQQDLYLADNLIKDGLMGRIVHRPHEIQKALENKNVVIIGASSGIGAEIYRLSGQLSARPIGYSRSTTNTDVRDMDSIRRALDDAKLRYGDIDFVINTTGLLNRKPLLAMTEDEIYDGCQTNYLGVINVARASFDYLKESCGMLLNFTSSSYTRGRANYSIYSSTKAAVVNFTQAIAEEWMSHGVKVNVINPERTATPMRTKNFGVEPPDTLLTAREVAEFTLSAMSFMHTGQIYSIKTDI